MILEAYCAFLRYLHLSEILLTLLEDLYSENAWSVWEMGVFVVIGIQLAEEHLESTLCRGFVM